MLHKKRCAPRILSSSSFGTFFEDLTSKRFRFSLFELEGSRVFIQDILYRVRVADCQEDLLEDFFRARLLLHDVTSVKVALLRPSQAPCLPAKTVKARSLTLRPKPPIILGSRQ